MCQRSQALGILVAFQLKEGRGFRLVLTLGSPHFPLFGILALQLLKQDIPCIKSPLFEISSDGFCVTACTLNDTGDKLLLMEKSSIVSGLEKNEGVEGRWSLWERKG